MLECIFLKELKRANEIKNEASSRLVLFKVTHVVSQLLSILFAHKQQL